MKHMSAVDGTRTRQSDYLSSLTLPFDEESRMAVTREPIKPLALHSFHPVRCAKDDLLQGRVNRVWHRAVGMSGYADCIDDLGGQEISKRSGDGFFQPDGPGGSRWE